MEEPTNPRRGRPKKNEQKPLPQAIASAARWGKKAKHTHVIIEDDAGTKRRIASSPSSRQP